MTDTKRRRDRRSSQPPSMHLTTRDKAIVRAVYDYRLLKQTQIARLFFGGRSAAQRVLVRLYQHGYLERRFLSVHGGRSPTLYVLDKRGVELLRTEFGLDKVHRYGAGDLKSDFLAHLLAINDVRIAVTLAAARAGYELLRWNSDAEHKADYDYVRIVSAGGRSQQVSLIPDGYFRLKTPYGYMSAFVEMDLGTMTLARFQSKVRAYLGYHRSGAFERRYQAQAMRVLTVTSSLKRLENLKGATEAAGGRQPFAFAPLGEITPETVLTQPVWWVASESGRVALIQPR